MAAMLHCKPLIGLLAVLAFTSLTGCVERTLRITSTPSGALVYLNDQEVGRTPIIVPFTYYGVYDVRLEKEGYAPNWTTERASAPWWEYPGPDLIAEMMPDARSQLQWHFFLIEEEPVEQVDPDALLQRGMELRERISPGSSVVVDEQSSDP